MLEIVRHTCRYRQIINVQQVQQKYSIIKTIEVMHIFQFIIAATKIFFTQLRVVLCHAIPDI